VAKLPLSNPQILDGEGGRVLYAPAGLHGIAASNVSLARLNALQVRSRYQRQRHRQLRHRPAPGALPKPPGQTITSVSGERTQRAWVEVPSRPLREREPRGDQRRVLVVKLHAQRSIHRLRDFGNRGAASSLILSASTIVTRGIRAITGSPSSPFSVRVTSLVAPAHDLADVRKAEELETRAAAPVVSLRSPASSWRCR
jgi:hypothetical protein